MLLSTHSLKSGFLENPSLIALGGRIWSLRDPLLEHIFWIFVKKMVLPCKNEHFMVSEASRPAAHGLSSMIESNEIRSPLKKVQLIDKGFARAFRISIDNGFVKFSSIHRVEHVHTIHKRALKC
mgnify:CR=1 FL=1